MNPDKQGIRKKSCIRIRRYLPLSPILYPPFSNPHIPLSPFGCILLSLLLLTIISSPPIFGQDFPIDMESLKREFMQGISRSSVQRAHSEEKKESQKTGEEAGKTTAPKMKFPSIEEIMARSDVAFIDPDKYVLGPGDNLTVIVYGRVYEEYKVIVQPDGSIFLNPAGPIFVKGKTINQARRKIADAMSPYYRELKLQLLITKLRTIEVRILGEVASPGTFVVTPAIGACDAIGMAGGLKENASLRNVVLKNEKGKILGRVDLFAWYFLGDKSQNRNLDARYEIYVPLMQKKVTVDGSFRRKGSFEITPGERVSDLLKMVELDTGAVLTEGKLTRINPQGELEIIPINFKDIIEKEGELEKKDPLLADGDALFVPNLDVFMKKIRVIGELNGTSQFARTTNKLTGEIEIQKLGLYNLKKGEKVKDVVIAMGGVTAKADEEKARVERPLGNGEIQIIPINLRKLMNDNDESQNITLAEGDTLIVPPIQDSVYILGEVRSPGAYQYNVGNKIKEYVTLAGGPTKKAGLRSVRVITEKGGKLFVSTIDLRSILTGNAKEDLELRPGDVIYVPYADISTWRDIVALMADVILIQRVFGIR